jgi:hypothetical protein
MLQKAVSSITKTARPFLVGLVLAISIGLVHPTTPVNALEDGTYSCGAYGAGNYSEPTCNSIAPPDTGFAVLLQPNNLAILIGSLVVLGIGISVLWKLRRRKA